MFQNESSGFDRDLAGDFESRLGQGIAQVTFCTCAQVALHIRRQISQLWYCAYLPNVPLSYLTLT